MLAQDTVDEELQRGFGLSMKEIEPILTTGGDAAEMKSWNAAGTCRRPTEQN